MAENASGWLWLRDVIDTAQKAGRLRLSNITIVNRIVDRLFHELFAAAWE
jgi:hypothetical protein